MRGDQMRGNYQYGGHHEYQSPFGDTTFTKVFVGGLAWETPTEKMRAYFEQFGEILEAVVICDKTTGKSKGYGFVTFRDPAAAQRACIDANPYIDGRRANCNIAAFGLPRPNPPKSAGRNQGVGAQGQSSSSSSSSSHSGMPTPQQTLPIPFFYHPYAGYPAYMPYGYQGIYNPGAQVQQSQYHGQYYGVGSSSSSGPYYYGYSMPNPRAAGFGGSTAVHRVSAPSNLYYPTQMEAAFAPYPNPAPPAAGLPSTPCVSPSSAAAATTTTNTNANRRQQPPSSATGAGESEVQESTSTDTHAVVIHNEGLSTSTGS